MGAKNIVGAGLARRRELVLLLGGVAIAAVLTSPSSFSSFTPRCELRPRWSRAFSFYCAVSKSFSTKGGMVRVASELPCDD